MNRVLVTGATGFLGKHLVMCLATEGNIVHALYRSEESIRGWEHENIRFFKGSLADIESLDSAMKGCRYVYHLAAFAAAWSRDSGIFYRENVQGTENVMKLAMKHGIIKMVHTSSAGVLGPSNGSINTEEKLFRGEYLTHYDLSKAMAEQKVLEYVEGGLPVVIVNPTRIFGPGNLGKSNYLTLMAGKYMRGKWRILPGDGKLVGNYVYVEDVASCLLLAMQKGKVGERYLIAGENISYNEFFRVLRTLSGSNYRLYKVPAGMIMLLAVMFLVPANLFGWEPPITPSFARRLRQDWLVSNEKAKKELGYRPISFRDGLKKTIEWIQS